MTDSIPSFICRFLKYVFCISLAVATLVLVEVLCFEQDIPAPVLRMLENRLSKSAPGLLVTAESASFRFARGLTVRNLRVFDRNPHPMRADKSTKPLVMSAARVDLRLDLWRLPWEPEALLKGVTLVDFRYPRLPEGYYIPDSIEKPGQPDFREVDEPVRLKLPTIRPFRVRLERPDILSVAPKFLDIPQVEVTPNGFRAENMRMQLPDSDVPVVLEGGLSLDLDAQSLSGEVHGRVRQHNVRPMLVALDITNSYQFIDAFTHVEPPVRAVCRYDVNLCNNDLHLSLELHPQGGRYLGVPLQSTDGTLDIRVFVRNVYQNADIHVNLSQVVLADGTRMKGGIRYCNTNDVGFVDFDVESVTSLSNALAIADVMTDGTLDSLCITGAPPRITLQGRLAVKPDRHPQLNDLAGTLAFKTGSFLDIPLRDVETQFNVKGSTIEFAGSRALSQHGGSIAGEGAIVFRDCWTPPARFSVDLACTNTPLPDLAEAFGFEVGDVTGVLDGRVGLSGPIGTNVVGKLNGGGRISCQARRLAHMKFFSGLTSFLAKKVMGGAHLEEAASLDFSRAACDFSISNGVLRTDNLLIEGRVLSIVAAGSYDIPDKRLDVSVRVKLLKWDLGGLTKPISWVSESLLDFKVTGSLEDPQWAYSRNPLRLFDFLPKIKPGGGRP